jgi:hypothetical protein
MESISYYDAIHEKCISRDVVGFDGEIITKKFSLVEFTERELDINPGMYRGDCSDLTEDERKNRVLVCRTVVNVKMDRLEKELFKLQQLKSKLELVNLVDNWEHKMYTEKELEAFIKGNHEIINGDTARELARQLLQEKRVVQELQLELDNGVSLLS